MYLPDVPSGLLALHGPLGAWARSFGFMFGKYQALHPYLTDVTPQQVQRVHRLQRRIHVWTVNAAEDMRRLFRWGVDAIFTDDPQVAVQVRGETR
jgi:glycerophosphoryl diester phosphodiesterase